MLARTKKVGFDLSCPYSLWKTSRRARGERRRRDTAPQRPRRPSRCGRAPQSPRAALGSGASTRQGKYT